MKVKKRLFVKFVLVGALVLSPATSFAHAHLHSSEPAQNSVVSKKPSYVVLHFTEALEIPLCKIEVRSLIDQKSVSGTEMVVVPDDAKSVSVKLDSIPDLKKEYQVKWRVVSTDSHSMQGEFKFTFDPAPKAKRAQHKK